VIVRHYLELLRYYRRLVILIVSGVTSATLAVCLLFMYVSPIYVAETKIVILPTEPELAFTRTWLGSGTFDPASIMVQTHEQYLLSRTVAERALDNLLADFQQGPPPTGLKAELQQAFKEAKGLLWRIYATLNYGSFVPVGERQELLNDLQDALDFEWVEGSFVMLLSAYYSDPVGAAKIANAVAQAYVEIKQDAILRVADDILGELRLRQEEKVLELQALTQQETALNESLGVQDRGAARSSLLDAIATAEESIRADELALAKLIGRRSKLLEDERRLRSLGLAGSIEQEIALADTERVSLETALQTRRQSAVELKQRLTALTALDEKLIGIEDQKKGAEAALQDLNERQTNLELVQNTAVDQVRIIDPAVAPIYPYFPKTLIFTVAAVIGSALLAAFAIVALDTFSDTVKTTADLRRLFGERSLDRLPASLCRRLAAASGLRVAGLRVRQSAVIDDLATRLRLLGAVFPPSILVVGLHSDRAAASATRAIAVACAAGGMDARSERDDGPEPRTCASEPERSMPPRVMDAGYGGGRDILVRDLGLVGRGLDWFQVTQELNVLVCAVVPGEATESLLARFDSEAEARGVPLVLFIICDA
jgi:succinoglycan biosynthesis transport protein ExoP